MKRRDLLAMGIIAAFPSAILAADEKKKPSAQSENDTYDRDTVLRDAQEFFGKGAEGLAGVIEKDYKENGRPNGYIKGQEAAGAITVGLIYGDGTLAPIRLGVGLRAGASIGYVHYTPKKTYNPF